ncbi:MAG TPA: transglutaminase-like cysteine peptidase [Roseiarcus sp.]|jgi:predicted transglutaminase-like cysteine proteinase
MGRPLRTIAVVLFAALLGVGEAQAQSDNPPAAASAAKAAKVRFGESAAIPSGYYALCVAHPEFCRVQAGRLASRRDGSVILTAMALDRLNAVNESVNAAIRPAYGESWLPDQAAGDCKDYAMTKRQRLIEAGWPTSAVPVAIVRTPSDEKHLVLVARTDQGDFVLDNLARSIVPLGSAAYVWEKILSPTDGLSWVGASKL